MDKEALFPSANALPAHRRYSLACEHPVRNSAHSSTFLEPNRFKSAQQIGEGKDDAMRKARRIRWLTERFRCCCNPCSVVIGSQPDSKSCGKATHHRTISAGRVSRGPALTFALSSLRSHQAVVRELPHAALASVVSLRLRNSRIASAISPIVRFPTRSDRCRRSALGVWVVALERFASGGRKNGSCLPQTASSGGRFVRSTPGTLGRARVTGIIQEQVELDLIMPSRASSVESSWYASRHQSLVLDAIEILRLGRLWRGGSHVNAARFSGVGSFQSSGSGSSLGSALPRRRCVLGDDRRDPLWMR